MHIVVMGCGRVGSSLALALERLGHDVAVVDRDGVVIKVATLQPGLGATRPRFRATATVEAPAGAMSAWGVGVGSRLVYESAEIVSGH